ncbi:hypothetical protein EON77_12540, partial [bacterium]
MINSVHRVGMRIARQLPSAPNRAFSPVTLWTAFQILLQGTAGKTHDELHRLAKSDLFTRTREDEEGARALQALGTLRRESTLDLATGLWTSPHASLDRSFSTLMKRSLDASVSTAAQNPIPEIDAWTRERTRGRMGSGLSGVLPDWNVVLVSTLYYRGGWEYPFDPARTRLEPFYALSGTREVAMMHRRGEMAYFKTNGCPGVALPLDGAFHFVAILPPKDTDPWAWLLVHGEAALFSGATTETDTILSLPRFVIDDELDMIAPLRAAGVSRLFENADVSPMGAFSPPVIVDQAHQSNRFEVDERGAEAIARFTFALSTAGPAPK